MRRASHLIRFIRKILFLPALFVPRYFARLGGFRISTRPGLANGLRAQWRRPERPGFSV